MLSVRIPNRYSDNFGVPKFRILIDTFSSDHVRGDQEHRLDGVLLEHGPQVLQEHPHSGEEPLDTNLRHRERSERLVTELHRGRVGWDDVRRIPFCKNFR